MSQFQQSANIFPSKYPAIRTMHAFTHTDNSQCRLCRSPLCSQVGPGPLPSHSPGPTLHQKIRGSNTLDPNPSSDEVGYHTTAHLTSPHHAMHPTPPHPTPPHPTPRHASPRLASPRHATPRRATPRHATPHPPHHTSPHHTSHLTTHHTTPQAYTHWRPWQRDPSVTSSRVEYTSLT